MMMLHLQKKLKSLPNMKRNKINYKIVIIMSTTLQRLGIQITSFSKDRQDEAVQQFQNFRLETLIVGEGMTFDWSNSLAKPDLIELKDLKPGSSHLGELEEEWEYAEDALLLFKKDNSLRLKCLKILNSLPLRITIICVTLINILAYCLLDFSTRQTHESLQIDFISATLEVICNIFFAVIILIELIAYGLVMEPKTYLRQMWNVINVMAWISTWSVLGDENNDVIRFLRVVRYLRAMRFVREVPMLRSPMDAFVGSFPRLGPILVPLIFVIIYYTIIGLHLFMGLTERRCRLTPEPVGDMWPADPEIQYLCGIWQCPHDRYCGNPADYGIPRNWQENLYEPLGYGFDTFDDFFYSFLGVFTFINIIGWSGKTMMYWKAFTTYVTAFFFLTLIFILAFVLSNLLLATFYESFVVRSSIKSLTDKAKQQQAEIEKEIQEKRQKQMMGRLANLNEKSKSAFSQASKVSLFFSQQKQTGKNAIIEKLNAFPINLAKSRYFTLLCLMMILLNAIVLSSDHHRITAQGLRTLQTIDFICAIFFFVELFINVWGKPKFLDVIINQLDSAIILSQFALFLVLWFASEPLVHNNDKYVELCKSIKIIRLIKLLYKSKFFYTINILTRCFLTTLIKIRNMIILLIFLMLFVALVGRELLANTTNMILTIDEELIPITEHNLKGQQHIKYEPPELNFNTLGNSLIVAANVFYNEEWHVSMYQHATSTKLSFVFYVIAIIFSQFLFVRLYAAVFLNEFCKQLKLLESSLKPMEIEKSLLECWSEVKAFFGRKRQSSRIHSMPIRSASNELQISPLKLSKQVAFPPQQDLPSQIHSNKSMIGRNLYKSVMSNNEPGRAVRFDQPPVSPIHSEERRGSQEIDGQFMNEGESDDVVDPNANDITSPKNLQSKPEKTLFIFPPNSEFRQLVTTLVQNEYFRAVNFLVIIVTAVRTAMLTPIVDPDSDLAFGLRVAYIFTTLYYILVILLNCVAFGLYKSQDSYFRQSLYNVFSFVITIMELITLIFGIRQTATNFITSLRILQFLQIAAVYSKDISYAQKALVGALTKMAQLTVFCFILFVMYSVLALKLLKGALHYCSGLDPLLIEEHVHTRLDCMDYGGSWVNSLLTFDSVPEGVLLLFVFATSEGWFLFLLQLWSSVGVESQPIPNYNRWWAVYFQVFFFIGNLCMLNMFIGLVVNAYNDAKAKAQHLHLLDDTQKEWFHIKSSIFEMKPLIKSKKPKNMFRKVCFFMVKNKYLKILWLIVILINTLNLACYYHRQDLVQRDRQDILNIICITIFTFEIFCRFVAKDFKIYMKDTPNIIDILGIWICLINLGVRSNKEYDFYFRGTFNAISIGIQLSRNYKIIKRFNHLEKLFSSIVSVIPSALSMTFIMFIFLFIFSTLGMDMFAYLRPQKTMNGWDLHFRKFTTAMFSLVRVASIEQWFFEMIECAKTIQPDFACLQIDNYEDFLIHGFNGCGTNLAYLFYIAFHLIFSLVILNLFIASVIDSYDEHVKSEESAISKYQLNDVLSLWVSYDPDGQGFINYKDFWQLSSKIAIIFGVHSEDLLDVNNKRNFLKVLNIPIYENKISNVFCYRFHDVILSLTKISVTLKYGVTNLEPTDRDIIEKISHSHHHHEDHNIHDFNPTAFRSGDMVAILYIQKKFRVWKQRALYKEKPAANDFGDIKNLIRKQIEKEEEEERLKAQGK